MVSNKIFQETSHLSIGILATYDGKERLFMTLAEMSLEKIQIAFSTTNLASNKKIHHSSADKQAYLIKREKSLCVLLNLYRQMASGLEQVHKKGQVWNDGKPANCFFTKNGELLLGDFGMSTDTASKPKIGTIVYSAPEAVNPKPDEQADPKNDIWSITMTMLHFITGKNPMHTLLEDNASQFDITVALGMARSNDEQKQSLEKSIENFAETVGNKAWRGLLNIMKDGLMITSAQRPTATDLTTKIDALISSIQLTSHKGISVLELGKRGVQELLAHKQLLPIDPDITKRLEEELEDMPSDYVNRQLDLGMQDDERGSFGESDFSMSDFSDVDE